MSINTSYSLNEDNEHKDDEQEVVVSTLINDEITPVIAFSSSDEAFDYIDKQMQDGFNTDWLVES